MLNFILSSSTLTFLRPFIDNVWQFYSQFPYGIRGVCHLLCLSFHLEKSECEYKCSHLIFLHAFDR